MRVFLLALLVLINIIDSESGGSDKCIVVISENLCNSDAFQFIYKRYNAHCLVNRLDSSKSCVLDKYRRDCNAEDVNFSFDAASGECTIS